ncbi:MAG: sigma-70 family RNA polymerase sigma factor [Peptococcaceae bacterium]|nr:sigma-70 family RNA polymerase sigma factor [Peptococcaceae bacterium]
MTGGSTQEDLRSFEAIYNHFYVPVYRFFTKRLVSKELCEDLTNDVFYSCLKNYDRYDPAKATVATWVYSIANNRIKNYYRDKKDYILTDDTDVFMGLPNGIDTDMDGAVFLSQMKTHLTAALGSLTDKERSIVMLRYYSDLTSDEIACKTGTTSGNVRVILTRTLRKLENYFKENGIRWE